MRIPDVFITNTQLHTKIPRGDFVKTLGDYELDMSKSTFQQDNDPKHTVPQKIDPMFFDF